MGARLIGSCWLYTRDDMSWYRGSCVIIVAQEGPDALGDSDYRVFVSPHMRVMTIQDTIIETFFVRVDKRRND